MRIRRQRMLGVVIAVLFGGLFALILLFNSGFGMNNDIQYRCVMAGQGDWPQVGGPYYENTVIRGEATGFPLGHRCTYDSPDDDVGPQEIVHERWAMTFVWLGSGALAAGGLVLSLRSASALD